MKKCWDILEIAPTIDIDAIKSARRSLMKSWHPDVAGAIDEKAAYNARCAEINAAYDQAVNFAKAWRPYRTNVANSEAPRVHRVSVARTDPIASIEVLAAFGMMFFILASRSGFRLFLFLVPFAFAAGLIAVIDWLLLQLAIRPALPVATPPPYKKAAAWLLLTTVNIFVLRFGLAEIASLLFGFIAGPIFDITVGLAIPLWISFSTRDVGPHAV
jgi:hypothetical protein